MEQRLLLTCRFDLVDLSLELSPLFSNLQGAKGVQGDDGEDGRPVRILVFFFL